MRRRYDFLFGFILNSGLRISEALRVKVRDVCLTDGVAKSVRIIGKGNRERLVPLPEAFGQVFGYWLSDKPKEDFVFAKEQGDKAPGAHAVRAYLRHLIGRAGIDKKVTPHNCGTPTPHGCLRPALSSWTSRPCSGMWTSRKVLTHRRISRS